MRWVRAAAAAILLAALLVGVPFLLLSWGHLDALLSVDWPAALTRPDDGQVLLGLLTVAGWLAWGLFAITTALEAIAALTRRRVSLRLPGTGWLRPTIATLIAAATLAPATAMAAPPALPSPPPMEVGTTDVAEHRADPAMDPSGAQPTGRSYIIQAGDELWDIAERELGAGDRWREILALNSGLTVETRLAPGRQITLPPLTDEEAAARTVPPLTGKEAAARTLPPPADEEAAARTLPPLTDEEEAAARTVTVGDGDSLWAIAEEHLGDPQRWMEIHELNHGTVADPDEIEVGWQLRLPTGPLPGEEPPPADEGAHREPVSQVTSDLATPLPSPSVSAPLLAASEPPRRSTAEPPAQPEPVVPILHEQDQGQDDGVDALLGSMGAVLAASLAGGLAGRRRLQALGREMGRRIVPLDANLSRFWTALARRADEARQPGATGRPTTWMAGWTRGGEETYLDLEARGGTFVAGSNHSAQGLLGTAITSLLCAPWSEEVSLVIADAPDDWAGALDDPSVTACATSKALAELRTTVAERRIELSTRALDEVRTDAALASSWAPLVFVFARALTAAETRDVEQALSLGQAGVSVLAVSDFGSQSRTIRLEAGRLILAENGPALTPQLVDAPARRALVSLLAATGSQDTEPAPWWAEDAKGSLGFTSSPLPRRSAAEVDPMPKPTLLLLGDVSLEDAAGSPPSRARMQCIEYCAWLLQHPGATAPQMQQGLLVAESTRRSNMSRLRTWLGVAPDGQRYLPDAYSGRIQLHPSVSSDWERFEALTSGGINLASNAMLADALALVRGAPLASVSFQWPWAEDLRATMEGSIVDAACVLFDRSLAADDAQTAQWALNQGQRAAPLDESLASREVQYWAHQGDRQRADQAVLALTRSARAAGKDLHHTTVARIQHALHSFPTPTDRIRA